MTSLAVVPSGVCLTHGPHAGHVCPTCASAARIELVPQPQTRWVPYVWPDGVTRYYPDSAA